ncbi:MAG: hypothetical protein ACRC2T_08770, partial [Thermoguttaceae bacterium]
TVTVYQLTQYQLMNRRTYQIFSFTLIYVGFFACTVSAQFSTPNRHYVHTPGLPPGNVAKTWGNITSQKYVQPIEFRFRVADDTVDKYVPTFSFVGDSFFSEPIPAPAMVGLEVGSIYRFKISDIPYHEGRELYPTIEIIDRITTPRGKELEFPIVIELEQSDFDLALAGKFVTRVIYLEDPEIASPQRSDQEPVKQDVPSGVDPVIVADTLGKPVAIVRIGGRVPNSFEPDPQFYYGFPKWTLLTPPAK